MKAKLIITLLLLFPISGCVTYTHAFKARKFLVKLQEGQSKNDVLHLMEHLPHRIESHQYQGAFYEIWFYNIQERYTDKEKLIPLVFKNQKLIGWGQDFYDDTIKIE